MTQVRKANPIADVAKMVSGAGLGQLILILASPVLTRVFSPGQFGIYDIFLALVMPLGIAAAWRYEAAIVLPSQRRNAAHVAFLAGLCVLATGLLAFLAVYFFRAPILRLLNTPALGPYLVFVPLAAVFFGMSQVFIYWCTRLRRFGAIALSRAIMTGGNVATALILAALGYGEAGSLILGFLTGNGIALLLLIAVNLKSLGLARHLSPIRSRLLAKRYKNFPIYMLWAGLLNVFSTHLPIILLAVYFSDHVVGNFGMGMRLIALPATLIGMAFGQVFFERAASARRTGHLSSVVSLSVVGLIYVGLFPLLLFLVLGPEIMTFAFGMEWEKAGIYAQILSVSRFIAFLASPLTMLFIVFEKQKLFMLFSLSGIILGGLAIGLGGALQSDVLSLLFFSAAHAVYYGGMLAYALSLAKIKGGKDFNRAIPFVGVALLCLAILAVLKYVLALASVILFILAGLFWGVTLLAAIYWDRPLLENLFRRSE